MSATRTASREAAKLTDTPFGMGVNSLSEEGAAKWLGISKRTLQNYRLTGSGPSFHKFGARIVYFITDLATWAARHRVSSTSEKTAAVQKADRDAAR
jgi:hypothetical protein